MEGERPFGGFKKHFATHFTIYIPATGPGSLNSKIQETSRYLISLFKGSTEIKATGNYMDKSSLIKENVCKIDVFTTPDQWKRHKEGIKEWLRKKRIQWKQKDLAIEFEEDMYWV